MFLFLPNVIDRYASRKAAQVLHGGGTFSNSGNRWFDKTLQVGIIASDKVEFVELMQRSQRCGSRLCLFKQFVVGEDGSWGLVYEQATAEGPPIANLLHHILEYW